MTIGHVAVVITDRNNVALRWHPPRKLIVFVGVDLVRYAVCLLVSPVITRENESRYEGDCLTSYTRFVAWSGNFLHCIKGIPRGAGLEEFQLKTERAGELVHSDFLHRTPMHCVMITIGGDSRKFVM